MADDEEDRAMTAKSAEDRKAASALANLDAAADEGATGDIDQDAVARALQMSSSAANPAAAPAKKKPNVRVDAEDVSLLVTQLDMTKPRATELLKQHDGDAVAVLRLFARG